MTLISDCASRHRGALDSIGLEVLSRSWRVVLALDAGAERKLNLDLDTCICILYVR